MKEMSKCKDDFVVQNLENEVQIQLSGASVSTDATGRLENEVQALTCGSNAF